MSGNPEHAFFASPPSPWLRRAVVALLAAGAAALLVWQPWQPLDRAMGHHPSAKLGYSPGSFDPAVRHRGAAVALADGEKADRRRALVQVNVDEPVARVSLVDDGDTVAWTVGWPPPGTVYRLDVAPGRWRYVQTREDLRGLNGPLIEERQQLDLRASQLWVLHTTLPSPPDGGATFGRPPLP